MNAHTQLDEARRWTRFPATLLFATCLLWLLVVLPRVASDWDRYVAQPSEKLIGALAVFLLLVVVPLASPLAGIGMLFLQRSALYLGAVLPFVPLLAISADKAARITGKFQAYREAGSINSFGDGVLDAVILAGLWLIAAVHVYYIRRALQELGKAEQWQAGAARPRLSGETTAAAVAGETAGGPPRGAATPAENEDTCFLLPESHGDDED